MLCDLIILENKVSCDLGFEIGWKERRKGKMLLSEFAMIVYAVDGA